MKQGLYEDDDGEVGIIPEGGNSGSAMRIRRYVQSALRVDVSDEPLSYCFNLREPKLLIPMEVL